MKSVLPSTQHSSPPVRVAPLASLLPAAALLLGVVGLTGSGAATACASCGCTLSKDWLGPLAGSVSGWSAGISYDFINQNQLREGTHNVGLSEAQSILNPAAAGISGQEVELQTATRTTTFNVDYNAGDWGVSIQIPFVDRYHTTLQDGTDAGYNFNQYDSLGDARIIGKYAGFSPDQNYGFTVGLKLPTGNTTEQFLGPAGGTIDPSLQPGTGSTDILLGAFYRGQSGDLGWFTQGTWQHSLGGQYGYTPGSALTVNAGVRYAEVGQAIVPLLQINLVHREQDSGKFVNVKYDGSPLTGGDLAYLAPGVSFRLGGGFGAYTYVQIPIYQDVKGVQLTPHYILSVGATKAF